MLPWVSEHVWLALTYTLHWGIQFVDYYRCMSINVEHCSKNIEIVEITDTKCITRWNRPRPRPKVGWTCEHVWLALSYVSVVFYCQTNCIRLHKLNIDIFRFNRWISIHVIHSTKINGINGELTITKCLIWFDDCCIDKITITRLSCLYYTVSSWSLDSQLKV